MNKKLKIKPVLVKSYLAMIKNSKNVKMFRNFYGLVYPVRCSLSNGVNDGKIKDLTKNGELSCVFFVSSILKIFDLIKKIHLSVDSTIKDLRASGWKEIKEPKVGSIIIWEAKDNHKHIGFYIAKNRAISNAYYFYRKRQPFIHHFTYNGHRKIEVVFWHKKLEKI